MSRMQKLKGLAAASIRLKTLNDNPYTMPKHLYIIGNGFDLHHGINSSYRDFMNWMNDNHCDVMCKVDEIYGICDEEWWSDFENQLASLDAIRYSSEIASENRPDLTSDHCDRMWNDAQIEVENQLTELYSDLRGCFHEWVLQLKSPLESRKIDLIIQDAIFINFNYTKTLENLYGINSCNIFHIHGCVDENEEFILGHGKRYEELDSLNEEETSAPPEDLDEYELIQFLEEQANSYELHEQLARQVAISGIASQRKPVEEIIKKHNQFFGSLAEITNIHVYGLSVSNVDAPYLKHILSIARSAKWEFSDYKGNNEEKIKKFCNENNLLNYKIIELNDLLDNKQLEINFPK